MTDFGCYCLDDKYLKALYKCCKEWCTPDHAVLCRSRWDSYCVKFRPHVNVSKNNPGAEKKWFETSLTDRISDEDNSMMLVDVS